MEDPSPLDDVEFFARSPHRVAVLQTLQGSSWTRPELRDEIGISQPTLGRVLSSLEDRSWVEQVGRDYRLTPLGTLLTAEFADLLDAVETFRELDDVIGLLPFDEMDFDLRVLGRSTVISPERADALGHIRRLEDLVLEAEYFRVLTPTMLPDSVEKLLEWRDDVTSWHHEAIFTNEAVKTAMTNPRLASSARKLLDTYEVDLFRFDGTVELMLGIADETAVLGPLDEQHIPRAFIESDDEAVRTWVESKLDEYRDASTRITVDELPG